MRKLILVGILSLCALAYPAACFAGGFQFDIDVPNNVVKASGTDTHIITKDEAEAFGISDHPLKQAIDKYFGKAPNAAYLHSKTPWGDLYSKYHWPQVEVTVKVLSATISHSAPETEVLDSCDYTNDTDNDGTVQVILKKQVTDSESHTWSQSNSVSVSQSVSYNICAAKGTTTISGTHQWGESKTNTTNVTMGTDHGMTVDIKPHQTLVANLMASKSDITITVRYLATISGDTAVNYNPTYKGPGQDKAHHFYGLSITNVMNAAKLPTTKEIIETFKVCTYSDAHIKVKDGKTGAVLHTLPATIKR